jgi:hypothetical protein
MTPLPISIEFWLSTTSSILTQLLPSNFSRIPHDSKENAGTSEFNADVRFWREIRADKIALVYKVYKMDFVLFGYDPVDYFVQIGLPEKATEVRKAIAIMDRKKIFR